LTKNHVTKAPPTGEQVIHVLVAIELGHVQVFTPAQMVGQVIARTWRLGGAKGRLHEVVPNVSHQRSCRPNPAGDPSVVRHTRNHLTRSVEPNAAFCEPGVTAASITSPWEKSVSEKSVSHRKIGVTEKSVSDLLLAFLEIMI
jgi:hypothetical protein